MLQMDAIMNSQPLKSKKMAIENAGKGDDRCVEKAEGCCRFCPGMS